MKMKHGFMKLFALSLTLLLIVSALSGCGAASQKAVTTAPTATASSEAKAEFVVRGESYSDKEHVAAYLRAYGELPQNYITKKEAQALGWVSSKGNLWEVAPGKSIGGDYFGNYEKLLPEKKGREWHECDIDFDGSYRNAKRILFSSDGLIYYTDDHYETFIEVP